MLTTVEASGKNFTPWGESTIGLGDTNAYGMEEIVVGSMDHEVYVMDGSGTVAWICPVEEAIDCVAVGDINGDGFDDVIAWSCRLPHKTLYAIKNSGRLLWSFTAQDTLYDSAYFYDVALADIE